MVVAVSPFTASSKALVAVARARVRAPVATQGDGMIPSESVQGSHFTHPEVGPVLLPFYLAVSARYGLLASATNSINPSMVLHAGGNPSSAYGLFVQGRLEWAPSAEPAPTIW